MPAVQLPSVTQPRSADDTNARISARASSGSRLVQPASQNTSSSSRCGTPSRAASRPANVVFPEPVVPTTRTRRSCPVMLRC